MSYLVLPTGARPHRAVSRDQSRPLICSGLLRKHGDDWQLVCTDSYQCAIVPLTRVTDDRPEPIEGLLSRESLKAIGKKDAGAFTATESTVRVLDELGADLGRPFDRPTTEGRFPPIDPIFRQGKSAASVAFNPRLLKRLADALGTETLELTVSAAPLKPILVVGFPVDARGCIMPIRTQNTPEVKAESTKKPKRKSRKAA